jgi:hypothetical protein
MRKGAALRCQLMMLGETERGWGVSSGKTLPSSLFRLRTTASFSIRGVRCVAALTDLSGENFGWLTVLRRADPPAGSDHRLSSWLCRCRCGTEAVVRSDALRGCSRRKCSPLCPWRRGFG